MAVANTLAYYDTATIIAPKISYRFVHISVVFSKVVKASRGGVIAIVFAK